MAVQREGAGLFADLVGRLPFAHQHSHSPIFGGVFVAVAVAVAVAWTLGAS
jgi:hypothetical protein